MKRLAFRFTAAAGAIVVFLLIINFAAYGQQKTDRIRLEAEYIAANDDWQRGWYDKTTFRPLKDKVDWCERILRRVRDKYPETREITINESWLGGYSFYVVLKQDTAVNRLAVEKWAKSHGGRVEYKQLFKNQPIAAVLYFPLVCKAALRKKCSADLSAVVYGSGEYGDNQTVNKDLASGNYSLITFALYADKNSRQKSWLFSFFRTRKTAIGGTVTICVNQFIFAVSGSGPNEKIIKKAEQHLLQVIVKY